MYASIFFLGGHNSTAVQSIVSIERTIFYREKAAGMYSAMPYAFALVSPLSSINFIYSFVYSLSLNKQAFTVFSFVKWRTPIFNFLVTNLLHHWTYKLLLYLCCGR